MSETIPGAPPGAAAVHDLTLSKLLRPLVRPGTVARSPLIERLASGDAQRIVSVVAPPGYGKTTLLSPWAERSGQTFSWVSVAEPDNDPKVLLTYVAAALDAVEPIGGRVFDALASAGSSVPGAVVPRLGSAFASMTSPVVLVLDDVHILRNRECRAALSALADHVPEGSRLVLAGRAEPPLRVPRLRAEGRLLEIGPAQLSLTREEASVLLANAGVVLDEDEITELHRRTEGWPAGLYLASPFPGHAAGAVAPRRARTGACAAAPRGPLVPAQRPARRGAGVLHRSRRRWHRRSPGGETGGSRAPARTVHHHPEVVPVAGGPGRDRGTSDGRRAGRAVLRLDGAAGRARPCTGGTPRRRARSWSAPSVCGTC